MIFDDPPKASAKSGWWAPVTWSLSHVRESVQLSELLMKKEEEKTRLFGYRAVGMNRALALTRNRSEKASTFGIQD